MVELKKSHGDNDHFFRYGPPKKMVKKEKWDLDVMGRFANGERWKPRHASFVMRRLQRALVKYRKDSLDLKEEPGKVYMVLYFFFEILFRCTTEQMASKVEHGVFASIGNKSLPISWLYSSRSRLLEWTQDF